MNESLRENLKKERKTRTKQILVPETVFFFSIQFWISFIAEGFTRSNHVERQEQFNVLSGAGPEKGRIGCAPPGSNLFISKTTNTKKCFFPSILRIASLPDRLVPLLLVKRFRGQDPLYSDAAPLLEQNPGPAPV